MRSSSHQSGPEKSAPGLQRSKSTMHMYSGDTPLGHGINNYTPQSGFGKITPGSTLSSKKVFVKDVRNLQDKAYLKEAQGLVQTYFQENCPEILLNGTDVHPMTRKLFLDMINHLFSALAITDKGKRVYLESTTFEKELPFWVKQLDYPGLITKGWLKTVNVPQYWPNVMGLMCWLVKLVMLNRLLDPETSMGMFSDDNQTYWPAKSFQFALMAYLQSSQGNDEQEGEILATAIEEFKQLFGCSEKIPQIRAEIEQLQQQLETAEPVEEKEAYDTAEQRLLLAKQQLLRDSEDIKEKQLHLDQLKAKNIKIQKNCSTLKIEIEENKQEIAAIEEIISAQEMSVEELQEVQKKCGHLSKDVSYLEKEAEVYQSLISKGEQASAEKRDKILQNNHAFNRNLIHVEQMIPDLKDLHTHMDPESEGFVQEMERRITSLEVMKNKYTAKCEDVVKMVKDEEKDFGMKKQKLKKIRETMEELKRCIDGKKEVKEKMEATLEEDECHLKTESQLWSGQLQRLQENIEKCQDVEEEKSKMEQSLTVWNEAEQLLHKELKVFWKKLYDNHKHIPGDLERLKKEIKEIDEYYEQEEQKLLQNLEEFLDS